MKQAKKQLYSDDGIVIKTTRKSTIVVVIISWTVSIILVLLGIMAIIGM